MKIIYLTTEQKPSARLGPAEIHAALSSLSDEHPVWRAVNQIVDEAIASATLDVSFPSATAEVRSHAAGSLSQAAELKARLHTLRAQPPRANKVN